MSAQPAHQKSFKDIEGKDGSLVEGLRALAPHIQWVILCDNREQIRKVESQIALFNRGGATFGHVKAKRRDEGSEDTPGGYGLIRKGI